MQTNPHRGILIVFEGLDGSGQSTQAELLREFLAAERYRVVLTKEPTLSSPAGQKIWKVLDGVAAALPGSLQILFAQDRVWHLERIVIPALKAGKMVISDRYAFSSFAFGASDGLNLKWLRSLNRNFLLPNITFLLKVRPKVCVERIKSRGQGFKLFEKEEKLARVWQTYEILPDLFDNIIVIDGERTIAEVSAEIKAIVLSKLAEKKKK